MTYEEIIEKLEAVSDEEAAAGMAAYGIKTGGKVYGVKIPVLRSMARACGRDRELAERLWADNSRETRILAGMIYPPQDAEPSMLDEWAAGFDNWEVCDQCCMNLFEKTPHAYDKSVEWQGREEEFVRRAGYVMMARLAVSDKAAGDEAFEQFFPLIEAGAADDRNFVRKAVNWALRQIGKRNLSLNRQAVVVAERIRRQGTKSARWIANDALRELKSEAVAERLKNRQGRACKD